MALAHVFAGVPYPYDDVRDRWLRLVADPEVCVEVVGAGRAARRLPRLGRRTGQVACGTSAYVPERGGRAWPVAPSSGRAAYAGCGCCARTRGRAGFYEHLGWAPTGREQKAEWPPYPVELEYAR